MGNNPGPAKSLGKFSAGFRPNGVIVCESTPMDPSQTPDLLSRTLASWRVVAPRNPQFRTAVRERIGAGSRAQPWAVYARRHAAAVGGALALALVAGAFTGQDRARSRVAAESARMAAAYVQGLDARSMQMK